MSGVVANATVTLVISTQHGSPAELVGPASAPHESLNRLIVFLEGAMGGAQNASIDAYSSAAAPVAATGTFTLASAADTNTLIIGGVTMTAKTSPSGTAQFLRGVSDTADAAAAVVKINAHPVLKLSFTATSALGVVTITCNEKGVLGNQVLTTATGNITAGAGALAGGTGGVAAAPTTYRMGL